MINETRAMAFEKKSYDGRDGDAVGANSMMDTLFFVFW